MSDRAEALLDVSSSPGVEIELYDHQFQPVARATERLSERLPVGLYKLQLRVGGLVKNELVALEPNGLSLHRDMEGWRSAAPTAKLQSTSEARVETQMHIGVDAWAECSRRAGREGAQRALFCFVSSPTVHSRSDLGRRLRILPFDGDARVLEQAAVDDRSQDAGWAWKSYVDPPRLVRLAFFDGLREVEQLVPTYDGYCTAVFLRHDRKTAARWGVQASATTVLMARLSDPAWEHRENHRYADLALRALERGGRPVSEETAAQLCDDAALDPLTRLYIAAHLISRWHFSRSSQRPEWALLHALKALGRLNVEAPDLPDVRLLSRWAQTHGLTMDNPAPAQPVNYPPMLNFSWSVGVQAAIDDTTLVAADSLANSASLQRAQAGPWFAWRAKPSLKPLQALPRAEGKGQAVAQVLHEIAPISLPGSPLAASLAAVALEGGAPGGVTSLEAAVSQALVEGLQAPDDTFDRAMAVENPLTGEYTVRRIAASFGLTANTVASLVGSTVRKLTDETF